MLDNPVDRGKPQSGAGAARFSGEERLENLPHRVRAHADSGVAYRQRHERTGHGFRVPGGGARIQLRAGSLNRDPPAIGHGVAGIHHQVHEHLVQLAAIRHHRREVRSELGDDLHVFADQPPQHAFGLVDHAVQVEGPRLGDLLAAEGQQLLGEQGGPRSGRADLFQRFACGLGQARLGQQHFAVSVDDGEQVVEVVRDAPGKASDTVHFLRMLQLHFQARALFFGVFAFGDVAEERQGGRLPIVLDGRRGHFGDHAPAAAVVPPSSNGATASPRINCCQSRWTSCPVAGPRRIEDRPAQQLGRALAQKPGEGRIHVAISQIAYHRDALGGMFHQLAEARFALPRLFARLHALGNVLHHSHEMQRFAGARAHQRGGAAAHTAEPSLRT